MKKKCIIVLLQVLLVLGMVLPVLAEGELVDRIVAIVNTDVIMLSELEAKLAPIMVKIAESTLSEEEKEKTAYQYREEVLSSMVSSLVARQECERLGVKVLEGEIDSYLERLKQVSNTTDEGLRMQLKSDGISMEMFRDQIRESILFTKLKNTEVDSKIVITDKEIEDFYNEHREDYQGKKSYHLRYIIVPYPENPTDEDKESTEKTIGEIVAMYKSGEPFPSLIEKVADGKIGGSGGDLGFFHVGDFTKEIGDLIVALQPGDVTPPIPVDQGLQVFWLEEVKQGEGRSLEEATQEIQMTLYEQEVQEKYKAWVSELEKSSYVKIIR